MHLSPVMISKWDLGFYMACDSDCIISGISRFSFSVFVERSMSLNNFGGTYNLTPPVTVMVLYGAMVLV